jgi:hypothetical protein
MDMGTSRRRCQQNDGRAPPSQGVEKQGDFDGLTA